ncbi:ac43-like protein [Clanis bilineata nucleopolyhedrovirus]|uniref:Ac43-like protein n=1 Tax=Clanis bilineata nucleopolyhedrovirus TaxID=1307957 RepID=Q0N467_9ABAC|nr:ac43-like protein [Clanis bilineata nucleopolyhedrovirus]ABF47376.1 ac43-like protein [Clanis bilineata nucleopolyhedrovirus]
MQNQYTCCYICGEMLYLYKKYHKRQASNSFFDKRRVIKRNMRCFCTTCYKDIFLYKKPFYKLTHKMNVCL